VAPVQQTETPRSGERLRREVEDALALRLALRRFLQRTEAACERSDLTPQLYQFLLLVAGKAESRQLGVSELAALLEVGQPAVSDLVRRALHSELIEREPIEGDRRRVILRLTSEGERRLAETLELLREERRALLDAVDAA
jgi:DNA-binding MarR family transcriptional regulator